MDNHIINKVNKLMQMSEKGTLNERKVAYLKVQKLMAKHNIDLKDLGIKEKIVEVRLRDYNVKKSYFSELQEVIAENFKCKYFVSWQKKSFIFPVFLGEESNVSAAVNVFKNAYEYSVKEAARMAQYHYKNYGSCKGVSDSFIYGFVEGIEEGFEEQLEQSNELSLMLVVSEETKEAYDNKVFSKTTLNYLNRNKITNKSYYDAGYEKGKLFSKGEEQKEIRD